MASPPPGNARRETPALKRSRIMNELVAVGMSSYGLKKFNTRHLPTVIHDGEHVMGVIYGRYKEAPGVLNWVDRMIVATDRRVLSLNHKPGYTDLDEFAYELIGGVEISRAGLFTAVTLNTRIKSVEVRFVNNNCADIFVHYIETRRLEFYESLTQ